MSDDQTPKVKRPATARQKRIRKQAQREAAKRGLDWQSLSKDERSGLKKEVRQSLAARRTAKRGE